MYFSGEAFVDAPIPTAAERHRLKQLKERAEALGEKSAREFIQELKEGTLSAHLSSIRESRVAAARGR